MRIDGLGYQPELISRTPVQRPQTPSPIDTAARVLSNEERNYFAELELMGPVTYGRGARTESATPPAALGQRIDLRA
ncbi:MAG: hypothetical protein KF785_11910 [Gemmatimonadales bacterium]|nr:hypothetical protein [Gemmatimonadales bacterium]